MPSFHSLSSSKKPYIWLMVMALGFMMILCTVFSSPSASLPSLASTFATTWSKSLFWMLDEWYYYCKTTIATITPGTELFCQKMPPRRGWCRRTSWSSQASLEPWAERINNSGWKVKIRMMRNWVKNLISQFSIYAPLRGNSLYIPNASLHKQRRWSRLFWTSFSFQHFCHCDSIISFNVFYLCKIWVFLLFVDRPLHLHSWEYVSSNPGQNVSCNGNQLQIISERVFTNK